VPVIKITARKDHYDMYPDILDYLVDIDAAVNNLGGVGEELFNLIASAEDQNEIIDT
jgi:hypothetical protein